ncbi:MAG: thioredoxin-dependent thiol peroxidase [Chitinophagaceae bacterium]
MPTHLTEGQEAPLFTAPDQDGNLMSLSDFRGQKTVLYFYPENDTPACTIQACNLKNNHELLTSRDYTVIGISPNDSESHQKFREKFDLPFLLLPDPRHVLIDLYGVWGEKNLYGRKYMGLNRTTFLIDKNGIILKIFKKPRNKSHAEEILKFAGLD